MDISQETIIGFLTGTVATIVLKGIVDAINKTIEFKRELKKRIYDKKLDAAESAVTAMFQNVQSSLIIINAIEAALNRDMDGELLEMVWNIYFKQIEKSEQNLLNSTASLYFQLDNPELWSNEDQQNLLDVYSKIKVLGEEIQYYDGELENIPEGETYDEIETLIEEELRPTAKKEIAKLKELLTKCTSAQLVAIDKIKDDFQLLNKG